MSNIFQNANLKVKEQKILHSTSSPDTSMMQVYENMRLAKEDEKRIKSVEEKMRNEKREQVQSTIAAAQMLESYLITLSNRLYQEGKDMVFKDIMRDIYLESLYLDDDFKQENASNIYEVIESYIDKNGGFAMLEAACKKEGTKLLSDMKEVVEKTSRKCAMRKVKDLKEACNSDKNKGERALEVMNNKHEFDMNDEEVKEYIKSREKLSSDEIVELVKGKVLDVIKDEKARQQDIERFEAEIAEQAESIAKTTESEAFKEAAMSQISQNTFVDMTLFESIQVSTMKEMMNSRDGNEYNDLDTYIEENDEDSFDDEDDILEDDEIFEGALNMDMVLAESITKYTLLEVFHTLKLENFTRESVQQLCLNLSK